MQGRCPMIGYLAARKKNCTLAHDVCSCKKLGIEREATEDEILF